jgi:hypothetical protein
MQGDGCCNILASLMGWTPASYAKLALPYFAFKAANIACCCPGTGAQLMCLTNISITSQLGVPMGFTAARRAVRLNAALQKDENKNRAIEIAAMEVAAAGARLDGGGPGPGGEGGGSLSRQRRGSTEISGAVGMMSWQTSGAYWLAYRAMTFLLDEGKVREAIHMMGEAHKMCFVAHNTTLGIATIQFKGILLAELSPR